MKKNTKSWLQLYVDAVTERDPYKRLALVEELRSTPRPEESEDLNEEPEVVSVKRSPVKRSSVKRSSVKKFRPAQKSKIVRRH